MTPTVLDGPLDLSNSQIIRCQAVAAGCRWLIQFQPHELDDAKRSRDVHEDRCEYRHRMP